MQKCTVPKESTCPKNAASFTSMGSTLRRSCVGEINIVARVTNHFCMPANWIAMLGKNHPLLLLSVSSRYFDIFDFR